MGCYGGFGTDEACGCGSGKSMVSFDRPTSRYADASTKGDKLVQEFVCFGDNLKATFVQNQVLDPTIAYQLVFQIFVLSVLTLNRYIGSNLGVFNIWPGFSVGFPLRNSPFTPFSRSCGIIRRPRRAKTILRRVVRPTTQELDRMFCHIP